MIKKIILLTLLLGSLAFGQLHKPSTGGGGGGAVTSVFGRIGGVVANSSDYSFSQIGGFIQNTQLVAGGTISYNQSNGAIDADTSAGNTKIATRAALALKQNTIGLSGENYLSFSSPTITANPVNLSGTNVTGTLAAGRFPAMTNDVTTSAGSLATTIANNAVTNAKAAQMAANTIKANNTGSTANATDITVAQTKTLLNYIDSDIGFSDITTNNASSSKHGYLAKLPNDASKVLNGTGAFSTPSASGSSTFVQYNNGGVFGADAGLTWTVGSLLLGSAGVGSGNSSDFNIASGDASAANNSGNVTIKTGVAGNTSGDIDIDVGAGSNIDGAINIGGQASSVYLGSFAATAAAFTVGNSLVVSAGGAAITGGVNTDSYKLNSTGASNTVLKGNGTSFVQSTETYAVPGQVGTALTSDGTNWTAAKTGWLSVATSSPFTTTGQSLTNVTGLSFSASANSTYEIDAWIDCSTSAVATGVEFGVNCSGTSPNQSILYFGSVTSTTAGTSFTSANNTAETVAFLTTSSERGFVRISGLMFVTGAGTISIAGLKVVSGTLTVNTGSKLLYRLQ